MSDPRYRGGVLAGIAKSRSLGAWPESIPGLGPRVRAELGMCIDCVAGFRRSRNPQFALDGGWMTYGGLHLCMRHAQARALAASRAGAA